MNDGCESTTTNDACCPNREVVVSACGLAPAPSNESLDDDPQARRHIKAVTAASALWVVFLIGGAFGFLYGVTWLVKTVFGWFGIY